MSMDRKMLYKMHGLGVEELLEQEQNLSALLNQALDDSGKENDLLRCRNQELRMELSKVLESRQQLLDLLSEVAGQLEASSFNWQKASGLNSRNDTFKKSGT